MNEDNQLIIALCGSTIEARKVALAAIKEILPEAVDLTIGSGTRATWRRGDALFDALDEFRTSGTTEALAIITCHEEAESIEMMGGHVVHVEGTPSDDIAIQRHTKLLTMRSEGRGRYTTVADTVAQLIAK